MQEVQKPVSLYPLLLRSGVAGQGKLKYASPWCRGNAAQYAPCVCAQRDIQLLWKPAGIAYCTAVLSLGWL